MEHGYEGIDLTVSIVATWQITCAPYASDYSRYLPPAAEKGAFWVTYWGTILGSIWLMTLGLQRGRAVVARIS